MHAAKNARIFIGSSKEGLDYAEAVQVALADVGEPTVWNTNVFKYSRGTLENLLAILDAYTYAVFVCTPDDMTEIRGEQVLVVRDNVIFELGLFLARLGRDHVAYLVPADAHNLHLPSDLAGVTKPAYDPTNADRVSAVKVALYDFRQGIKSGKSRSEDSKPDQGEVLKQILGLVEKLVKDRLTTEYVGTFPGFFEKHVCSCIESAEKTLSVACDFPAYGYYSDHGAYARYMRALKRKALDERPIQIHALFLNASLRKVKHEARFSNVDWEKLQNSEQFVVYQANVGRTISNVNELIESACKLHDESVSELEIAGVKTAQTTSAFPIYLWIADQKRAVFSIPTFDEIAVEHGFVSTDEKLISALVSVWNHYNTLDGGKGAWIIKDKSSLNHF